MKRLRTRKIDSGGNDQQMFGIPLFGGDKAQVLNRISNRLKSIPSGQGKPFWIATVNPEFVMKAVEDDNFKEILQKKTSLNVVDGIGLVWAKRVTAKFKDCRSSFLGRMCLGVKVGMEVLRGKYKNRVAAGSSLMGDFCRLAKKQNYRVFFLGGWEGRAGRTANFFEKKYKGLQTAWSSGEPEVENARVLAKINKFKPDFLFVAYGMKKQEEWIERNLSKLEVGVVMGVGRSFDYYSGEVKRASKIWCDMGLEWLYSLIKEPKRWRRQLALPRFVGRVIKEGI